MQGRKRTATSPNQQEHRVFAYPIYRDWGKVPLQSAKDFHLLQHEISPKINKGGKRPIFLKKLYSLLSRAEQLGYADIICWRPHGRSFIIKDRNRFEKEILPAHFSDQTAFASFQRQLNVYGFLRMTKRGPDHSSYYHELFLRGRPDLIELMQRQYKALSSVRRTFDSQSEPNLDLYPLPATLDTHLSFQSSSTATSQQSFQTTRTSLTDFAARLPTSTNPPSHLPLSTMLQAHYAGRYSPNQEAPAMPQIVPRAPTLATRPSGRQLDTIERIPNAALALHAPTTLTRDASTSLLPAPTAFVPTRAVHPAHDNQSRVEVDDDTINHEDMLQFLSDVDFEG